MASRHGRFALRQQIRLLVRRAHEAGAGCVGFAEDDMADRAESCAAPCRHEFIDLVPAVKADTEGVRFENPVDLAKGRIDPVAGAVVFDALAVPAPVIAQVGRIG